MGSKIKEYIINTIAIFLIFIIISAAFMSANNYILVPLINVGSLNFFQSILMTITVTMIITMIIKLLEHLLKPYIN